MGFGITLTAWYNKNKTKQNTECGSQTDCCGISSIALTICMALRIMKNVFKVKFLPLLNGAKITLYRVAERIKARVYVSHCPFLSTSVVRDPKSSCSCSFSFFFFKKNYCSFVFAVGLSVRADTPRCQIKIYLDL